MESNDSNSPATTALLVSEEFLEPLDDIGSLAQYVSVIQNTLLLAQEHLRNVGRSDGIKKDETLAAEMQKLHRVYCRLPDRLSAYSRIYHTWEAGEASAYEKSEVRFSLGQIERLQVVAKNIQRISAEALGIPDPEMQQTMMEMQLVGAGKMRFDD